MVEKKHVVFDLRLSYNGPLSIEKFYAEVEKWMEEKGMHKDQKRKTEDVRQKGKKIEWVVEAWKEATHLVKPVVRLRALFNNVKELKIKRRGRTVRLNQADVLIVIDGFVEAKLAHQWSANPLYTFLRALFDKYIWNIGMTEAERFEGVVNEDCYDLHKRLKAFFNLYRMKVG
ncbi:MAG: hypothetical protein QF798_03225 [Candidatus Woesearchaeota archaeon]|jgi:hypothetical protein|nr:hypothetical protein [Candidatus Woesearchaeota archaeon]|tara:strand:- start:326 stop:844 length:519 start_codon:yes stop_codon:yes gene_type:complete